MKPQYLTPAVTTFDGQGNLDGEAQKLVYDHLLRGGVSGVLVLGSIGEFFAMSMDQKKELVRLAVSHIEGRIPVIVGAASTRVEDTLELADFAFGAGADAVMMLPPYFFSLADESVEDYYDYVVPRCAGRVYLYNFPDRTGYDLSPTVALNLVRKHSNIVGYKDSVASMNHTRELIKLIRPEFPDFQVYSGFDDHFVHNVMAGGSGCIGGLSNLAPELCSAWINAFKEDDLTCVTAIQKQIDQLMSLYLMGMPFVPFIKRAMTLRGLAIPEHCSFPSPEITADGGTAVKTVLERAGLL